MAADDWNCALEFVEKSPAIAAKFQGYDQTRPWLDLFDQAARTVPFSARLTLTFLEAAPYLIDRLGPSGLDSIRRWALAMAADHTEKAVTLLRESPGIVDQLLAHITPGQVVEIVELGSELSQMGSELALGFILGSVELSRTLEFSTLRIISETAKTIAGTSRNTCQESCIKVSLIS